MRSAGKGGVALRSVVSANADQHAADLPEVMADIRGAGHVTLRALAAELNRRGVMTKRGGCWRVSNVRNLLVRLGAQSVPSPDAVRMVQEDRCQRRL